MVQLATGEVRHYIPAGPSAGAETPRLAVLRPSDSFPAPCAWMLPMPPLPDQPRVSAAEGQLQQRSTLARLQQQALLNAPPSTHSPPPPSSPQATPPCAPAVGLTRAGQLYWGSALVAPDVTSVAARAGGPGGPALLYCTRRSLMYTVFLSQLAVPGGYAHKELTEAAGGGARKPR